jgi:hypothetical protein
MTPGDNLTDSRGDMALIRMALRKGWSIPEATLERAAQLITQGIVKHHEHPRNLVALVKTLVEMDRANLTRIALQLKAMGADQPIVINTNAAAAGPQVMTVNEAHEVAAILRQIGIGTDDASPDSAEDEPAPPAQ